MTVCNVCFRHCDIAEDGIGFCGGRICRNGIVQAGNYGKITALALDPIEKKPLRRFHPGEMILSVGSYGCNLRCPFCQNNSISWSDDAIALAEYVVQSSGTQSASAFATGSESEPVSAQQRVRIAAHEYHAEDERLAARVRLAAQRLTELSPEKLASMAQDYENVGNMGVAFTYNEPLIGYEFVRDTASLVHENGMVNVLVTNGTASQPVLEEVLPFIDAMNIDLKGFTDRFYSDVLNGDRWMVMDFIERAAADCHVELTTLIIPGENDSEEEIRALSKWVASLDPEIPLHLTRFFPQFHMTDRDATDVGQLLHLVEIAKEQLEYVYAGNC